MYLVSRYFVKGPCYRIFNTVSFNGYKCYTWITIPTFLRQLLKARYIDLFPSISWVSTNWDNKIITSDNNSNNFPLPYVFVISSLILDHSLVTAEGKICKIISVWNLWRHVFLCSQNYGPRSIHTTRIVVCIQGV